MASKGLEKLVNNSVVDHLQKRGLFADFQYVFKSFRSTTDLLTVASDRIARAFNNSGATRAELLIYLRLLTGFGMLVFFTNVSLMEFQVRCSSFLSNRWLWVVLDGKSSQKYLANTGIPLRLHSPIFRYERFSSDTCVVLKLFHMPFLCTFGSNL